MALQLNHQEIKDKLKEILSAIEFEKLEFAAVGDNSSLEIHNKDKRRKACISISPYKMLIGDISEYRILINTTEEEIPVAFNIDKEYTLETTTIVKAYDGDFYKKLITCLYSPSLFSKWVDMGNSPKIPCFEVGLSIPYPASVENFNRLHESHCISIPLIFSYENIHFGSYTLHIEEFPFGPINLVIRDLKPNEEYYLVINKRKQFKLFNKPTYLTHFEKITNHVE